MANDPQHQPPPRGEEPRPGEPGPRPKPPRAPLLTPGLTYGQISAKICDIVLRKDTPRFWWISFGVSFCFVMMMLWAIAWLFTYGVGIWGIKIPVGWGFAIVNFVWWIGIGHAGTLISAILLLMKQDWRNSINRFAEAMTLFAVACAGMFPLLHLGRPQVFYYITPYPDTMGLWPQWRSPLVWDVFAVFTYATVSLLFWYMGCVPDLATMRDRARSPLVQRIYAFTALGWRGSARHWQRYMRAYLLLGALATPLVVSVHSIVGLDFAVSVVPGWHSTVFPPYFVAGAIYSGFAMVLTLVIPIRAVYKLHDTITMRHIDNMAKVMLATGLFVAYGYFSESFFSWYSGNQYEQYMMWNRLTGPYWPGYWLLLTCNIFLPQLLWIRKIRQNMIALFLLTLVVNVGMWLERYIIVVTSLHRDYIPAAWGIYHGTRWDWMTLFGTIGFFFACMFIFIRICPMISIHEIRELIHSGKEEKEAAS